jgi:glycerol uptake facilitator-like aquaporin
MERKIRVYTTELIGTFCLVVLASGAVCAAHMPGEYGLPRIDMWAIALANGCALGVLLTLTASISEGCLNPVITLTLWVCRRLDGWQTVGLILTQLAGSLLAGLAVRYVFPESILLGGSMGTPHVGAVLRDGSDFLTWGAIFRGIVIETFVTFVLTVVVFYTILDRRSARFGGLFAGLAQIALTVLAFNLTGGVANPARWFGPAVWQLSVQQLNNPSAFADHMVYWAGPIVGALLGGLLYTSILSPPSKPTEAGT